MRGADRGGRGAFTLIESAVVTVVIAVLVALFLPALARARARPSRVACVNNLKGIELAFRIFANDNEERFPWEVPTNQGGSLEFVDLPFSAFHHFRVMSNELSTPRVLVCPQDQQRTSATNFSTFRGNKALRPAGLAVDRTMSPPPPFGSLSRMKKRRVRARGLHDVGRVP